MGWAIGFDPNWKRDIGYGVPAICDHPGCGKEIDRGLGYVCGGDVYGGEHGCGLFFCGDHLRPSEGEGDNWAFVCGSCEKGEDAERYEPTPDTLEWVEHKLTDESWSDWRKANPEEVASLKTALTQKVGGSCMTDN
jgi:hypothetical protein